MSEISDPSWNDVCFEMCMRCDSDETDGFKTPSVTLVAEFCRRYPQFADDLIDFAATCRTQDILLRRYPPPEPTKEEIDRAVRRAMRVFNRALKRNNRSK